MWDSVREQIRDRCRRLEPNLLRCSEIWEFQEERQVQVDIALLPPTYGMTLMM